WRRLCAYSRGGIAMRTIFLAFITLFLVMACDNQKQAQPGTQPLSIVTADGKTHDFQVELALTPAQQQRGLMNRREMAADHGMLFVFGDEAPRSFWMKNTFIPLDIVFIRKD